MHAPRRFRPSAFGDAGGRQAETPSDWLYLHANEFWFDDAKYLFLILGGAGLQTVYRPDGTVSAKFFPAGAAATDQVVNTLRARGRRATAAEVEALKSGTSRPAVTVQSAPTFTVADAPAAATPAKKRRRVKPKALAIYERTWFPFAVGGAALLVVGGIVLALKARKPGAA
jgi:hypothetical protein